MLSRVLGPSQETLTYLPSTIFQKPVEKKLRTFKQHQTLQVDEAIVANPGDRSTGKDVEKSISRDLLRKVKVIVSAADMEFGNPLVHLHVNDHHVVKDGAY